MTTYICGAGPTGLSLAWLLKNSVEKIVIIEKSNYAGGTWAARWVNGLYTHHSPQILSSSYVNTFKLWKEMGMDSKRFTKKYDPDWFNLILENTTFQDKITLLFSFLSYMYTPEKISDYDTTTVQTLLYSKLSLKAWKTINKLCYLIDGVSPHIMTVSEFYGIFNNTALYNSLEMIKPSDTGFASEWVSKLKEYKNITFRFNTSLDSLSTDYNNNLIGKFTTGINSSFEKIDKLLLATDPLSLIKILNDSDPIIKHNWGSLSVLKHQIFKGIYVSLSVQYHFNTETPEIPYNTKVGMDTEWGIICTKLPFVNTISCSVINLELFSTYLNKNVANCNPLEIKVEVWRQLQQNIPNLPNYSEVTMGPESRWENNKWIFNLSSACKTVYGSLNSDGRRKDMSIVGPINKRFYPATTMEAAVESALRYTKNSVLKPITLSIVINVAILIIILFFVINV